MLLLGACEAQSTVPVRVARAFERAHARLELAVLCPVDGARRLLLGEGHGLELAGVDDEQLAICQLNLKTTVVQRPNDVRRPVCGTRVEKSQVRRGICGRAQAESSQAVHVWVTVDAVNLNTCVEGEVAQLRRKVGSGLWMRIHDSPRG